MNQKLSNKPSGKLLWGLNILQPTRHKPPYVSQTIGCWGILWASYHNPRAISIYSVWNVLSRLVCHIILPHSLPTPTCPPSSWLTFYTTNHSTLPHPSLSLTKPILYLPCLTWTYGDNTIFRRLTDLIHMMYGITLVCLLVRLEWGGKKLWLWRTDRHVRQMKAISVSWLSRSSWKETIPIINVFVSLSSPGFERSKAEIAWKLWHCMPWTE